MCRCYLIHSSISGRGSALPPIFSMVDGHWSGVYGKRNCLSYWVVPKMMSVMCLYCMYHVVRSVGKDIRKVLLFECMYVCTYLVCLYASAYIRFRFCLNIHT